MIITKHLHLYIRLPHCLAIFFFSDIVNERIMKLLNDCIWAYLNNTNIKPQIHMPEMPSAETLRAM